MVITLQPSDAIFGYMGGEKREEKKGEEVEGHGKGRGREREREESGRGRRTEEKRGNLEQGRRLAKAGPLPRWHSRRHVRSSR